MQVQLLQQFLHRQVIDILAVKMDQARIDYEALVKDVIFDQQGHFFFHHTASPQFLIESLLDEAAANLVDWLTVTQLETLVIAVELVVWALHDTLEVQLLQNFDEQLVLDGLSDLLAALHDLGPDQLWLVLLHLDKVLQAL